MDKTELKYNGLLQRFSAAVTNYENQIAELRVELTLASEEADNLRAQLIVAQETPGTTEDTD